MRIASIDIGTNTVLLTIASCADACTHVVVHEDARITRLGEGLATHDDFCDAAMERTMAVLADYARLCREHQVERVIAVGTAAFRRAHNAAAFVATVSARCGIAIEIISGEREAALSFAAAARDFGTDALVLDIGGGSTECMWQTQAPRHAPQLHTVSIPIGSVVLHEQCTHSDPISATDEKALQTAILEAFSESTVPLPIATPPPQLIALAGTATTLAAMQLQLAHYSHAQVHGSRLSRPQIAALLQQLRGATLAQRKKMIGLEPARADVIFPGALLLHDVMQQFGYDEVLISDRGVRWGILYEIFSSQNI